MHIIIDYGVGNITSIQHGFQRAGMETVVSSDPQVIKQASSLILPGVGAFKDAMEALKESGLIPSINDHVAKQKPLLGICLGMQLLFERSEENGGVEGLGFLKGDVKKLTTDLKIPHMGWNALTKITNHPIVKTISDNDYCYFVHSYYVSANENIIVAETDYGQKVPAIIAKGNIVATQFHPEKSGNVGLEILKAYEEWIR